MYGQCFHGKANGIMAKFKTGGSFSVKQSYTDEQLTAYTIGGGNISLSDPMPIIDPYEEKIKEAQFKIEVLTELLEEMGVDVSKRIEEKLFLNKLSGEEK